MCGKRKLRRPTLKQNEAERFHERNRGLDYVICDGQFIWLFTGKWQKKWNAFLDIANIDRSQCSVRICNQTQRVDCNQRTMRVIRFLALSSFLCEHVWWELLISPRLHQVSRSHCTILLSFSLAFSSSYALMKQCNNTCTRKILEKLSERTLAHVIKTTTHVSPKINDLHQVITCILV